MTGRSSYKKISAYELPSFCHNFGNPYPWTEKKTKTFQMLVADLENLTQEEKDFMTKGIDDIIKDIPETVYSANKMKRILPKLGKEILKDIRKILVDIASETAKKILFPDR